MIYPIAGLLIGAAVGAFRAKSRGGKTLDMLQWGAAFAILFALLGLFLLIFLQRTLT